MTENKRDLTARSRLIEAAAKAAAHNAARWADAARRQAKALSYVGAYYSVPYGLSDENRSAFFDVVREAENAGSRLARWADKCEADAKTSATTASLQAAVVRAAAKVPGEVERAAGALRLAEAALEQTEKAADAIEGSTRWGERMVKKLQPERERLEARPR